MDWRLLEECDKGSFEALEEFRKLLERRGLTGYFTRFVKDTVADARGVARGQFIRACSSGDLPDVRALHPHITLDDLYKGGRTAAERGHLPVLKFLIEDEDVRSFHVPPISTACLFGHLEVVQYLLERCNVHEHNDLAIRDAARNGHADIVNLLLEHGANPQANGNWALREAAENGYSEIVHLLLEVHGRAVGGIKPEDLEGPLVCGSRKGHLAVVRLLVEAGADVNARHGEPLARASWYGHHKTTQFLLDNGALLPKER